METYTVSLTLFDKQDKLLWSKEVESFAPLNALSDLLLVVAEETDITAEQIGRIVPVFALATVSNT